MTSEMVMKLTKVSITFRHTTLNWRVVYRAQNPLDVESWLIFDYTRKGSVDTCRSDSNILECIA